MKTSFKHLLIVAALTSLVVGILLTLVQQIQIIPAVLEAEAHEAAQHVHNHSHDHGEEAWAPADGLERNMFTTAANIVIALGFALLLGAAVTLRGVKLNWCSGLLWGLAGYVVFFAAPALGLHPELPGTEAADLQHRQIWWLLAVTGTAVGLALVIFNSYRGLRIFGVVFIFLPHIIGAPQPEVHQALAPDELIQSFIIATVLSNAIFWLSLGGLYGFFTQKLAR